MTAIPDDIRIAAWNAAGHIYDPDNKCHAYATDIIAEALHAERLAAEKRGREEERERAVKILIGIADEIAKQALNKFLEHGSERDRLNAIDDELCAAIRSGS